MPSKQLVINGKFLLASLEGMPRVGREITTAFDSLLEDDAYSDLSIEILAPKGASKEISLKNIKVLEVGLTKGLVWEQIELPHFLGNRYCLNFTGTAPTIRKHGCVVVHDAQFFSTRQSHTWKSFLLYSVISQTVARRYRNIVTVSDFAKREILEYGVCDRKDISVIHNAADHVLRIRHDSSILKELGLEQGQFMLANSYVHHHKNVRILFEAITAMPNRRIPGRGDIPSR